MFLKLILIFFNGMLKSYKFYKSKVFNTFSLNQLLVLLVYIYTVRDIA